MRDYRKWLLAMIVLAIATPASAQRTYFVYEKCCNELTPIQKDLPAPSVQQSPVQKLPTPKVQEVPAPTQKQSPVQKQSPMQKGTVQSEVPVPIPQELLDKLERLQPQKCQPVRNLVRGIARCVVKKAIGRVVEEKLPTLPTPPGG